MRYIQSGLDKKPAKEKKPVRDIPKVGKYTASDLTAKGVKTGLWEKKDG